MPDESNAPARREMSRLCTMKVAVSLQA
jgi:hypothetical protein